MPYLGDGGSERLDALARNYLVAIREELAKWPVDKLWGPGITADEVLVDHAVQAIQNAANEVFPDANRAGAALLQAHAHGLGLMLAKLPPGAWRTAEAELWSHVETYAREVIADRHGD